MMDMGLWKNGVWLTLINHQFMSILEELSWSAGFWEWGFDVGGSYRQFNPYFLRGAVVFLRPPKAVNEVHRFIGFIDWISQVKTSSKVGRSDEISGGMALVIFNFQWDDAVKMVTVWAISSINIWLVVWNIFLFFHILGIIIPFD